MAGELAIPERIEDLTCEWLTSALRSRGVLNGSAVQKVETQILGAGEGFIGAVARLHLTYDDEAAGAPRTLIAKLPTTVKKNRAMGELLGAYEREIHVYEELGAEMPMRTPQVYYSDMDAGVSSERDAEGAAQLDRMPGFMIPPVMWMATKVVSLRRRKYVLLIEDLRPGATGDQIAGCSPEACEPILRGIARMHAAHWNGPVLEKYYWLRRLDLNPRTLHHIYRGKSKTFRSGHAVRAGARMQELVAWLDLHAPDLIKRYAAEAPHTLQHCDLRLDNVFFFSGSEAETGAADGVAIFDWQLAGRGPGVYDVAYFLSGALEVDAPPEAARDLVLAYHAELEANGVEGYSAEACLRDYYRALPIILHRLASTDAMELDDARGKVLIGKWADRTAARLEGVDLDGLLA